MTYEEFLKSKVIVAPRHGLVDDDPVRGDTGVAWEEVTDWHEGTPSELVRPQTGMEGMVAQ